MPYRLSSRAEQDLDEIWLHVAEETSPATADRLIDDLVNRFDLLTEQPRMGRLRPEFGPGVRSLTFENHVVYYWHDDRSPECFMADAIRLPRGLSPTDSIGIQRQSKFRELYT